MDLLFSCTFGQLIKFRSSDRSDFRLFTNNFRVLSSPSKANISISLYSYSEKNRRDAQKILFGRTLLYKDGVYARLKNLDSASNNIWMHFRLDITVIRHRQHLLGKLNGYWELRTCYDLENELSSIHQTRSSDI
ncbi:unnamed protein product [Rhizophagus irregularis]|nr:unnamed protein product [Rhizophagus irregularis]